MVLIGRPSKKTKTRLSVLFVFLNGETHNTLMTNGYGLPIEVHIVGNRTFKSLGYDQWQIGTGQVQ
jgi:hypothetical protein